MSGGSSEFEKKLQAIGAKYAHMYVARKPDNAPMKEFKLIEKEPADGMSGMAEVLAAHQPTTGMQVASGVTCQCGYWNGNERAGIDRPAGLQGLIWHQSQMLTAAGFGDVREAKAQALEEAAEEFGENQSIREGDAKEWLRARAAAVRGEG